MWITPAFQGKRRSHEAVFHVLDSLFSSGEQTFKLGILLMVPLPPSYYSQDIEE
jgi:hypothetical protein